MRLTLIGFLVCLGGCTLPLPPSPPTPAYATICGNLATLGCPEGLASNCATTFENAENERMADLKPSCLLSAKTQDEVRACGTVKCQP
jgi:hypothetical protein